MQSPIFTYARFPFVLEMICAGFLMALGRICMTIEVLETGLKSDDFSWPSSGSSTSRDPPVYGNFVTSESMWQQPDCYIMKFNIYHARVKGYESNRMQNARSRGLVKTNRLNIGQADFIWFLWCLWSTLGRVNPESTRINHEKCFGIVLLY